MRDIYLTDDTAVATTLVNKAIAGCEADDVEEIRSLGKTLSSWRTEIVAHHRTGASNGPTEGLILWSLVVGCHRRDRQGFCGKTVSRRGRVLWSA